VSPVLALSSPSSATSSSSFITVQHMGDLSPVFDLNDLVLEDDDDNVGFDFNDPLLEDDDGNGNASLVSRSDISLFFIVSFWILTYGFIAQRLKMAMATATLSFIS
jgi:hypothetical protein